MTAQTSKKCGADSLRKVKIIGALLGVLYMPFGFYLWYLLLKHIQATDLMWFVWLVSIPLAIALRAIKEVIGDE